MYLSHVVNSDSLIVPKNFEKLSVNKLLTDMKLLSMLDSGCISYSPLLARIKHRIEKICMDSASQYGFNEVILPMLMQKQLLEKSGKLADYSAEFYFFDKPHEKSVLVPTTEEPIIQMLMHGGLKSYKQLPMRFSQLSNVYRHLKRSEGLYKSREISCVVLTSADFDQQAFLNTVEDFKKICSNSFKKMGIPSFYVQDEKSGAIEYMFETESADRPLNKSVIRRYSSDQPLPDDDKSYGSLSMGYPFYQSKNFDLTFDSPDGKKMKPVIGTFGIGTQRCVYALFEKARNQKEKAFTKDVRPFDVMLVQVGKESDKIQSNISQIKEQLEDSGLSVVVDDRPIGIQDKLALSEFLSIPSRILVGKKEAETGSFTMKDLAQRTTNSRLSDIIQQSRILSKE